MNTETLQHIQENIILLSLLNREPGAPCTARLDDFASHETAQDTPIHYVPLNREYEIAECLAFLSGTTDDPKKVTALSIEENEGGSSLVIRIATNSGVDDKLWCQFQTMAKTLQTASHCAHSEERQKIISQAVLTLDRERLLSRLRSRHAQPSLRNLGRPTIISRLAKEGASLVIAGSERSSSFQKQIKSLQKLFAKVESFATEAVRDGDADDALVDLMRKFDSLPSQHVLEEAFRCMGNTSACVSDTSSASLVIAVAKIRRYWAICEFLSIAVRRYSIFHDVKVARVAAELPFVPTASLQTKDHFQKTMLRLNGRNIWKGSLEQFCQEKLSCSLSIAEKRFFACMKNLHPGVHAEVQLLMFYESHPDIRRPRVISSSKSACFLCNLLLLQHGQFYVGKTHGVLYRNWAMPAACLTRFSGRQLQRIHQIIKNVAFEIEKALFTAIQLKPKRSHPNESVADLPMFWTPSLISPAHTPPSPDVAGVSKNPLKSRTQEIFPKNRVFNSDQAIAIPSPAFRKKKQNGDDNVTIISDHVTLDFTADVESNNIQYGVSHPSTPLVSPQSSRISVSYSTETIYLQPDVPIWIRFRAHYNILVIAGGLILELSGETSNDACGGHSRSNTIFCALTSSSNTYTSDGHLVDLDAMEAGESRDIELKEEIDSSSLFLGKSMFLKYGKTTVALFFGD